MPIRTAAPQPAEIPAGGLVSDPLVSGGLVWGGLGMLLFSMSLPATRLAVDGFDPVFVAAARGAGAGLAALPVLMLTRGGRPWPRLSRAAAAEWGSLAMVALGVVIGWPLLTTIAMAKAGAIHGAVLTGLLPAATAIGGVLLARERPSLTFWLAAASGLLCVLVFAVVQGAGHLGPADGLLLLAVAMSAMGYAAGATLARRYGGAGGGVRVISLALVLCLPLTLPTMALHWDGAGISAAGGGAWAGLLYVVFVSQYLGFFAWYRGLAQGGVARIGQLQLAQPVLSMAWAVLLLGEAVTWPAALAALAVLGCVVATQRAR